MISRRWCRISIGTLGLLLAAGLVAAQPAQAGDAGLPAMAVDARAAEAYEFAALRALLKSAVESGTLPCASLLLIHHDRVVFKEAFGWADIEARRPLTTDTICRLASSTKWITGATLAAAVEDGLVALDDPIGKHLPELADLPVEGAEGTYNPTLRQCFSHTAGFAGATAAVNDFSITLAASVERIPRELPELRAIPGTDFRYGAVSMQVAGGIVEKVAGEPYEQYMRRRLLGPLGMVDTTFSPAPAQWPRVAVVYAAQEGGGFKRLIPPPDAPIPARRIDGGMFSTLDDYGRFLLMIRHGGSIGSRRVLAPETVTMICSDQTGGAPITASPYRVQKGYGLGVAITAVDQSGRPTCLSDGGAFGTHAWIDLDRDLEGVFFTATPLRGIYELVNVEVPEVARAAVDAAGPTAAPGDVGGPNHPDDHGGER